MFNYAIIPHVLAFFFFCFFFGLTVIGRDAICGKTEAGSAVISHLDLYFKVLDWRVSLLLVDFACSISVDFGTQMLMSIFISVQH